MIRSIFFSVVLVASFCVADTNAQKQIENREMTWFGFFNQTRFTEKSGIWVDAHLRLNDDFINETHAILGRVGYTYYIADRTRLTVGHAYQLQPGHHGTADVREHRPWQQIQWTERKKGFNMMQWFRFEQRFRDQPTGDYTFSNFRMRYNISFTIPLNSKEVAAKTFFAFTNNEVFVNFGKKVVYNYFDQNRFFAGFGYQYGSHSNVQFGYMNVFQQLASGDVYVNTDAIRIFVFHNLDLRKSQDH